MHEKKIPNIKPLRVIFRKISIKLNKFSSLQIWMHAQYTIENDENVLRRIIYHVDEEVRWLMVVSNFSFVSLYIVNSKNDELKWKLIQPLWAVCEHALLNDVHHCRRKRSKDLLFCNKILKLLLYLRCQDTTTAGYEISDFIFISVNKIHHG